MVGVAGDSGRVKHQQVLRAESFREIDDGDRQLVGGSVGEMPVRVTEKLHRRDAEHLRRGSKLASPDIAQLAGDTVQR